MDPNNQVVRFFDAVNNNDVKTVQELLNSKTVEVDVKNPIFENQTALHIAARKGFDDLTKVLVDEFSAPVNVKDDQGRIPLQMATDICHKSIAQFLVNRNSELSECATSLLKETMEFPKDNNEAVLQFFKAVKENEKNKVKHFLTSKEVNVDVKDPSENRTALHFAAEEGYLDLARILVDEFGAQVNITDGNNQIPLQVATDHCHMKITRFLLQRNSEKREYAECMLNENPKMDELFDAAESNDINKVLELIKEQKFDVNSRDKSRFSRSILHLAVLNGHKELVRLLIDELNADIQLEDEIGDTPFHVSVDQPEISDFLLERGYKDQ